MASHTFELTRVTHEVVQEIINALESIEYGALDIQIHHGLVVQLERREKRRFDKRGIADGEQGRTKVELVGSR